MSETAVASNYQLISTGVLGTGVIAALSFVYISLSDVKAELSAIREARIHYAAIATQTDERLDNLELRIRPLELQYAIDRNNYDSRNNLPRPVKPVDQLEQGSSQ